MSDENIYIKEFKEQEFIKDKMNSYRYTRVVHFRMTLRQINQNVPDNIINIVKEEIKDITLQNIRQILHKNGLTRYYEYVPNIYLKISDINFELSKKDEKHMEDCFEEFCTYFNKYIIQVDPMRKSMLPYGYLINKISNKLCINLPDCYTYKIYTPYKVKHFDEIWDQIFLIKYQEDLQIAVIMCQKLWRNILAKRQLHRLRLKEELEYIPNFGIKYFEAQEHFTKNM